jgi:cystathionine beta-lyase
MDDVALAGVFMRDLKMALDPGIIFGTGGSGFMRLNFACPRENLSVTIPS